MSRLRPEIGLAEAALLFAALGDETRLELVRNLRKGPASISALAANFQVSRQAITKHLRCLSDAGIIHGSHEGREHLWTLNPARLAEARRCLEVIAQQWDDALGRLKAQVEKGHSL